MLLTAVASVGPAKGGTNALAGRRALVVDDSAATCFILRSMLEREGMSVDVCEDGEQAVARVRSNALGFDLIMVDLVMQRMGGIEAMRRIRRLPVGAAIAICPMTSTDVTPELEQQCLDAGATVGIMRKPYGGAVVKAMALMALQPAMQRNLQAPSVESLPAGRQDGGVPAMGGVEREVAMRRGVAQETLQAGTVQWLKQLPESMRPLKLARHFPRVANKLCALWPAPDLFEDYLAELMMDTRVIPRKGFPFEVAMELAALIGSRRSWVDRA